MFGMGAKESECNTEVPEGVIIYSGNEATDAGKYTLRAVINNKNYKIRDGGSNLDRWDRSFEWEIVQPTG